MYEPCARIDVPHDISCNERNGAQALDELHTPEMSNMK